ncbi:macrolide 2'-phosphotransferase [Corallococcus macrosporus]|uniref:Aminoglycoside phosphotransferase n=1 Tax=Corallococcus macrosporus DSM 14697 TaxID=1189310 RepID=A0A250JWS4_9BACT|nr:macrolide 2'-phosphotransferase [Corallococcus macrosporus]ATB47576.1 aminoglycoside phosphotransferase [Corallococcus macrosporus DSM 14697]
MSPVPPDATQILELAASHGLKLKPDTLSVNEAGLDYRVVMARDLEDTLWVLRIPRREDVSAKLADEKKILDFIGPRLGVAVPNWHIAQRDLIAYPALPGRPGLTLNPTSGEPVWHFDRESRDYARQFGQLLARMHAIDVEEVRRAGLVVETPEQVRATWASDLARVRQAFDIAPALTERWERWLGDDSYWPRFVTMTHGEPYPAHVLLAPDDTITGVLDWTTAKVGDPARDFVFQKMLGVDAVFEATVDAYVKAGGQVWDRLGDHCVELLAASPLGYALYALTTGLPEHRAAAQAQLTPEAAM